MANNKKVISYSVMLSMKEATNETAKYKKTIDGLKDSLDVVNKKLAGLVKFDTGDTVGSLQKERKNLEKEIKLNTKNLDNLVKSVEGIDSLMKRLTTANYNELTNARTVATNALKRLRLDNQNEIDKFKKTSSMLQKIRDEINKRNMELNNAMNRQKAEKVLNKPGGYSTGEIEQAIKTMQSLQSITKRNSQEWRDMAVLIENGKNKLEQWSNATVAALAKQRQANLSTLSTRALDEQRKYWQQEVDGADKGSKAYDSYIKKLERVNKELNRRKADSSSSVMKDLTNNSVKDIQEAIKATEQLRDAQKLGSRQWNTYNNQIVNARDYLQKYADSAKQTQMVAQWSNIATLSANALEEQRKYWQQEVDGAEKGSAAYTDYLSKLQAVNKEITQRKADSATKVMNNLDTSSISEIQDAIKATEQLRDAQKAGSAEWNTYNQQVINAREYLQKYADEAKRSLMESQLSNIATLSTNALEEQRKYWQQEVDGAEKGSAAYTTYLSKLQAVNKEITQRKADSATKVMNNLGTSSISEIQDAIKATEQLRDAQTAGSKEWNDYNENIEKAREYLQKYADEAKKLSMENRLSSLDTASTASIEEQRKYWQTMRDGAEAGSAELKIYADNLQKVADEEKRRKEVGAKETIDEINKGWDKSIQATEEAVKQLKEYRSTLNMTDKTGLEDVDKAISQLTEKLKQSQAGAMSLQDALDMSKNVKNGKFAGTIEDLEKLKQRLLELRKTTVNIGGQNDKTKLKDIDDAVRQLDKSIASATGNIENFDDFIKKINSKSMVELKAAAEQLSKELENTAANADDFVKKSKQLRDINVQIKSINKQWNAQENAIVRTAKRLTSYVLVYAGFNKLNDKVQEFVNRNLELSDAMADVQKTTGLAGVELQELGKGINAIDTRTTNEELWNLAAAAGQIGLKTQDDVLGFVKGANMASVALKELGDEGAINLLKIADLVGDKEKFGVEGALRRVGSAINELTANTAATAGPIADFVKRIGGVGSVSNITLQEMAALGATADAVGQIIEVSGTSTNKLLSSMMSNVDNIAYAANISRNELRAMVDEGRTMDAIIRVFEAMQNMSAEAREGVMKELGSEGARMDAFVKSMVSNLDLLVDNIELSNRAYEEAVSVENEYNVKNESAIGILQRMRNSFVETFVNSRMVEILKDILTCISRIPYYLEQHQTLLLAIRVIIGQILAFSLPNMLKTLTTQLWGLAGLMGKSVVTALDNLRKAWLAAAVNCATLGKSVTGLTGFLNKLFMVIKMNQIGIIISAIGLAATALYHFTRETDKLAEATAGLNEKQSRERTELDAMRDALNNTNVGHEHQKRIINELNNTYGKYLDFQIKENDNLDKKNAALGLINAKLREQQALEMRNKQKEVIDEEYGKEVQPLISKLQTVLSKNDKITRKRFAEAMDIIQAQAKQGVTDGATIIKELEKFYNTDISDYAGKTGNFVMRSIFGPLGEWMTTTLDETISDYAEAYKKRLEDLQGVDDDYNYHKEQAAKETSKSIIDLQRVQRDEIRNFVKTEKEIDQMGYAEKRNYYKSLYEMYVSYQNSLVKMSEKSDGEVKRNWDSAIQGTEVKINELMQKLNPDAYGKRYNLSNWSEFGHMIQNLSNASVDSLVASLKKLTKETAQMTSDVKLFNEMFKPKVEFEDPIKVRDQIFAWSDQIRAELQRRRRGTTGEFLFGEDKKEKMAWPVVRDIIKDVSNYDVVDDLVDAYARIKNDSSEILRDMQEFYNLFGMEDKIKDDVEANKQMWKWAEQIKKRLEQFGRNTSGQFIFEDGGNKGKKQIKQEIKEQAQAALSALEAYYAERETLVRQKMLEQGASEAETNRQLEALNVEHWNDQKQLYMKLLDDMYKQSTFDKKKFVGPLSGLDYFNGKDLDKLRKQLSDWGIAMEDGMKNQLMKVDVKIAEQAQKIALRIQKLLLDDDFNAQVLKQYTESLDELGMLYNQQTESENRRTRQSNADRMAIMRDFAEQSYTLTADSLRGRMEQLSIFQDWVKGRTQQDYEALLVMLRKYHDDVAEADKKQAERRKKIIDSSAAAIGLEAQGKQADKRNETAGDRLDGYEQLGIISSDPKTELQIDYYKQKISLAQQYIDIVHMEMQAERMKTALAIDSIQAEIEARKKMGLDTSELDAQLMAKQQLQQSLQRQEMQLTADKRNEITAQTENLNRVFMESEQRKLEEVKKYTDSLVTFAGDMGEAAFGEVEDRKEAGRQLIKSLLTTLKDWAQVKLTELAMKEMFAAQSAAIEGQEIVTDLTMQGAKTSADISAGTASATAKEAGKLGLKGLLVGAAIGAALSALLAVAMSAISKSKSTVTAASGTGTRLATGMLTYAQGKYPVLGNDGQVYDAKYEGAGMKTGVYSGGPRVGIFSEKQPEAVIDGRTTRRLVVDYPGLWQAILSLSRGGTLPRSVGSVRTYAQGNLDQLPKSVVQTESAGNADNERLLAALEQSNRIQSMLIQRLSQPIEASINMYGDRGLKRSMDRANKFSEKRKIH